MDLCRLHSPMPFDRERGRIRVVGVRVFWVFSEDSGGTSHQCERKSIRGCHRRSRWKDCTGRLGLANFTKYVFAW